MCSCKEKIIRHAKRQKIQFEETKQASKPDMAGMLELSDWKFRTTMINTLRALMDKVDSMQEQMSSVNRETEILRRNQNKNARDQNTAIEMKNHFDEIISRVDMAYEIIYTLGLHVL